MTSSKEGIEGYSPETEATVLACMLNTEEQFSIAKVSLTSDDFYTSGNRKIFRIMLEAHDRNGALDLPSLIAYWKDTQDDLPNDECLHLMDLNNMAERYHNIQLHCHILKDFTIRRDMVGMYRDGINALDKGKSAYESLQRLLDQANFIRECHTRQKISLKFICEQDVNYIFEEAPEMPRLINFIENGKQKPFIPKGIVAQLVGAGGVGKTHALAQLALSVATGSNWLGVYPIDKPGYVFICLGENKDADIHRLFRKIVKGQINSSDATFFAPDPLKKAAKMISVMSCTGKDATLIKDSLPTAFYNELFQALKDKQPEEGWSLIIFDPISRFLGADAETDNAAATQVIALLERITLELRGQPTVMFGHHMNKSSVSSTSTDQGAARGSSAITDGVRWQANLERVQREGSADGGYELNKIVLRPVKSNFTPILPPQQLFKDEYGIISAVKKEKIVGGF